MSDYVLRMVVRMEGELRCRSCDDKAISILVLNLSEPTHRHRVQISECIYHALVWCEQQP
jgi:hypothetical protein